MKHIRAAIMNIVYGLCAYWLMDYIIGTYFFDKLETAPLSLGIWFVSSWLVLSGLWIMRKEAIYQIELNRRWKIESER